MVIEVISFFLDLQEVKTKDELIKRKADSNIRNLF